MRASPLPPEERRASIIEATLPLLLEHGPSLTTKQVAEAAGVAEGTIFRAFPSLPDLIDATTREAMSAERLNWELDNTALGDSLEAMTTSTFELLTTHFTRMRSLLMAAHAREHHSAGCMRDELAARRQELDAWLIAHFSAHADELTTTPERFVAFLRTLASGHALAMPPSNLTPADLAHLALDGARKES